MERQVMTDITVRRIDDNIVIFLEAQERTVRLEFSKRKATLLQERLTKALEEN